MTTIAEQAVLNSIDIETFVISLMKKGLAKEIAENFEHGENNKDKIIQITKDWIKKVDTESTKKEKPKRKSGAGRPATGYSLARLRPIAKKLNGGKGPVNYTKMDNKQLSIFIVKKLAEQKGRNPPKGYKEWENEKYASYIDDNYSE